MVRRNRYIPTKPLNEPLVHEEIKEPEVEAIVDGVDTALNIRKNPDVKSNNQIGVAEKGTKIIVVDPDHPVHKNGEDWYKVIFNKQFGFAMKKYIKVM